MLLTAPRPTQKLVLGQFCEAGDDRRRSACEADRTLMTSAEHTEGGHGRIVSRLRWVLDVSFVEDASRIRTGFAGETFGVIRHVALNLVPREKTNKRSIRLKRRRCGWSREYLLTVVGASA